MGVLTESHNTQLFSKHTHITSELFGQSGWSVVFATVYRAFLKSHWVRLESKHGFLYMGRKFGLINMTPFALVVLTLSPS